MVKKNSKQVSNPLPLARDLDMIEFVGPDILDEPRKNILVTLGEWMGHGVPCKYARFIKALSPSKDKEPVFELKLESPDKRYLVKSLIYTPQGLIYVVNGEVNIVPLANIVYVRTI